jgi:hypothetical protein
MRRTTTTLTPEAEALLKRHIPDARVVAENIIKKHGMTAFQLLIQLFQDGAPTRKVMKVYAVSRQRVSQWREALGTQVVSFEPSPRIVHLLPRTEPRATRRVSA